MDMKRFWKIILILLAVIVVLAIFGRACGGRRDITEVYVEQSALRTITETVSASGKIQPETEVKIQSEVSGQIIELLVKEGDHVEKGQLLVRINPDIYNSALNRAEAALNGARSSLASAKARLIQAEAQFKNADLAYQRATKLKNEGAVSAAEYESTTGTWETSKAEVTAAKEGISAAEFNIASAEASRNEAADNLRRTTITAPMSGTVTALAKEVGESVLGNSMMSGDVIMRISALNTMEVNVEVNESDIVRVNMGDTAIVEVDAYLDEKFKGIVTEIGNTALNQMGTITTDQVTNFSVKVRILPESYSHLVSDSSDVSPFRPGMSAAVDIQTDRVAGAISIPIKAVTSREDTTNASLMERIRKKSEEKKVAGDKPDEPFTCVFVLNETNQTAQIRMVKTGIQDNEFIQIIEGLGVDETVITGPYDEVARKLDPGDKVEVKKEEEEEEKEEEEE
ncbi:MAG: efflux RND transporter periplasmic adaptor subunit [Flavobacteriales bacterium]|nr:efflux RND transporter periplasmic adaptor subunit [Flavobacteriales bacterium]